MNEEEQKIEKKILPWRFWLTVTLSALLIVTFVLYLPTRFLYTASMGHSMNVNGSMAAMPAGHTHGPVMTHEESIVTSGIAVNLEITPTPVFAGNPMRLDFFVSTKPENAPVPAENLEVLNTKLMHVIGIRDDMEEFFHIHPQITSIPGVLSIDHIFEKPGRYKLWSEITKNGETHITGHKEIIVEGEGQPSHKQVFFGTSYIVDGYQVFMHYLDPIVKNQPTDITFEIHDNLGRDVNLADYLGVKIHLTIIKDDWKQFIHTHPIAEQHTNKNISAVDKIAALIQPVFAHGEDIHEEDTTMPMPVSMHGVPFNVTFPEAGVYRVFAQFKPSDADLSSDQALTASFWVQVAEKSPTLAIFRNWWVNLFAALILMMLLSLGIKAYLRPGI